MNKPSNRFIIIGAFKYVWWTTVNYICFLVLEKLNILDIFDKDLLPCVDKCSIIIILSGALLVLLFYIFKKDITILNIFIKRYETSIKVFMFLVGILTWQRCVGEGSIYFIYALIMYVYYMAIEFGSTRTFNYEICKDNTALNCYEERPIIGRDLLTKPQIDALNQLNTVLKTRNSVESVNIALVGKWGTGKTSIIETLIYELQNDKSSNIEYFILKIDMGMLKKPVNVVEYVKNYFYILFRQYGISSLGSLGGLTYFSSFQKLLEETNASLLFKFPLAQNENFFQT